MQVIFSLLLLRAIFPFLSRQLALAIIFVRLGVRNSPVFLTPSFFLSVEPLGVALPPDDFLVFRLSLVVYAAQDFTF